MRVFVTDEKINSETVTIDGSDALHLIRSLRLQRGEQIVVCDMRRREYICEAERITSDTVVARILQIRDSENEPPYHAVAYLALSKGDRFEFAIQKSVELGVAEIVPFESERTIVGAADAQKKQARRRKIAAEAASQCGRAIIPTVRDPIMYSDVVSELKESAGLRFICYEGDGTQPLPKLLGREDCPNVVAFAVGPEGGFSAREIDMAREAEIPLCGLGKRILRCETAPLYVLAALSYEFELMRHDASDASMDEK